MPEPLFERLNRETTTMDWQPPEVIRRRGRRRTAMRRAAVLACSFVALVLIAVGATLYIRPTAAPISPGAPVPISPSTSEIFKTPHATSETVTFTLSPLPTLVAGLMLQPADVPGATLNDQPRGGYDGTLESLVGRCGQGARPLLLTYEGRDRGFQYPDGRNLYQVVHQYATAADAANALDWYRGKVAACPSFDPGGGARTLTIAAQNFAGEESIAVQDKAPGGTDLHVFVRVGNRLSEIVLVPGDATVGTQLGQRAAAHL